MFNWNDDNIRMVLVKATEELPKNPKACFGQVPYTKLVYKMLYSLYERQTFDEQSAQATKHVNHIGFNGADARVLSDIAQKSKKYQNLTWKQAAYVAKRLKKYAGQLATIAASKSQGTLPIETPAPVIPVTKKEFFAGAVKASGLCPHGANPDDCDICESNAFGQYEAEQEQKAFESKMQYKMSVEGM